MKFNTTTSLAHRRMCVGHACGGTPYNPLHCPYSSVQLPRATLWHRAASMGGGVGHLSARGRTPAVPRVRMHTLRLAQSVHVCEHTHTCGNNPPPKRTAIAYGTVGYSCVLLK